LYEFIFHVKETIFCILVTISDEIEIATISDEIAASVVASRRSNSDYHKHDDAPVRDAYRETEHTDTHTAQDQHARVFVQCDSHSDKPVQNQPFEQNSRQHSSECELPASLPTQQAERNEPVPGAYSGQGRALSASDHALHGNTSCLHSQALQTVPGGIESETVASGRQENYGACVTSEENQEQEHRLQPTEPEHPLVVSPHNAHYEEDFPVPTVARALTDSGSDFNNRRYINNEINNKFHFNFIT